MTWLVLLCLWSGVAWGQISETRTDLHDGQQVYGLEVSTTGPWYTNALDIWLWAEGRTEPNYANVSFHAYGLYGDVNNAGVLTVTATTPDAGGSANATGIYTGGEVTNTSVITSTSAGRSAGAVGIEGARVENEGDLVASAAASLYNARANGIYARGNVDNAGDIAATATRGTATFDQFSGTLGPSAGAAVDVNACSNMAYVSGEAVTKGIVVRGGDISNHGVVTVLATGGRANSCVADEEVTLANGGAFGLDTVDTTSYEGDGHIQNTAALTVTAVGGAADGYQAGGQSASFEYVHGSANATGIHSKGDTNNSGPLTVTAIGGTANANTYADATGTAYGITVSGTLINNSLIDVNNTGAITLTATVGTANAA